MYFAIQYVCKFLEYIMTYDANQKYDDTPKSLKDDSHSPLFKQQNAQLKYNEKNLIKNKSRHYFVRSMSKLKRSRCYFRN